MINTNANEIKKIIVNCDSLPKTKSGKNDRVAIFKGLEEHKHTYNLTVTFIYNDWDEYTTTFTITKLLEDRAWVNVKDTGEGRFGTFSLLFNSLLQGTFKREAQEQSDIYYNRVKKFNAEKEQAVNEERQKTLNEQYKNKKLQEKNDNLQKAYDETNYELMVTKEKLACVENKYNNTLLKKPQFTFDMAKEFSLLIVTKGLKKASEIINEKYFN